MASGRQHRTEAVHVVIATWNIREMNRLFDKDNEGWVTDRRDIGNALDWGRRQATVLRAMDPDVLLLQEGPSSRSRMQAWVDTFLHTPDAPRWQVFGPTGKGTQRLFTLVRTDRGIASARVVDATMLASPWSVTIDSGSEPDDYTFTRRPLVVDVTATTGEVIRTINVHLKSPFVFRGEEKFSDPTWRHQFFQAYKRSRRRAEAEAMRLRRYLDSLLREDPDRLIAVGGDFNDGPSNSSMLDMLHLYGAADLVQGRLRESDLALNHVLLDRFFRDEIEPEELWTSQFVDFVEEHINDLSKEDATVRLLLDHIMVSPGFRASFHNAKVCHEEWALGLRADVAAGDTSMAWQLDAEASDHRGVKVTIDLPILDGPRPCGCSRGITAMLADIQARLGPGESLEDAVRDFLDTAS